MTELTELEEIQLVQEERCEAELKNHEDRRVGDILDFIESMRDNQDVEEYLEIYGEEICSPNATRANRYRLMVLILLTEKVGTFTRACQILKISHQTVVSCKKNYPAFKRALELASLRYSGMLIDKATDFAVNGWQEEIFGKGKGKDAGIVQVGTRTKRDMRILETVLGANVAKFKKQRATEVGEQKVEIHLNFGDGSKEIIDGSTGTIIDSPQLEPKGLPAPSVELHDDGFAEVEEGEL